MSPAALVLPQANLHAMGTYKAIVILHNKLGVHKKIQLWAQNYNAYHRQTHKPTNDKLWPNPSWGA